MKASKKYLLISIVFLTLFIPITFSRSALVADLNYSGYEARVDQIAYQRYESVVKYGDDVVFSTTGNGETMDYGVWIKGENIYNVGGLFKITSFSTKVTIQIYARCYEKILTATNQR